jgi:NitT/TauT family transport system substrate-binding protein
MYASSFKRLLQVATLTISGLLALTTSAQAQTTKIRVSTIPIIDTAPLQVGIAKGGALGLPALAAGQVQITFSNVISVVLGAKQGLGFEIIAAGSNTGEKTPDLAALIAKKGSTIKTGKDLEGKRVAVNTRNNIIWLYARAWVQATGGNPDAVTYLEVPFPQMVDAVKGDRVDAAFVVEPFLSAGVASDAVSIVGWPYNAVQKRIPVSQYVATKTFISQNPGVIDRWVRAYNKSVDWTNQNQGSEEWTKIIAAYTRLAPEQIRSLSLPPYEKTVDPASIDMVVEQMRKNKMIEGPFDSKALLYRTAIK